MDTFNMQIWNNDIEKYKSTETADRIALLSSANNPKLDSKSM